MPTSKRWKSLEREIETLRKYFLPEPFDPLGVYPLTLRVQAHTRGFLVLCHAEIESYFEEWAKEIARASQVVWTSSRRVTPPLAFLLVTYSERLAVPNTLVGPKAKDSPQLLADLSVDLFNKYYKHIRDNHGIKEKNVLNLFSPLGLPAAALGSSLPPNLDYLGELRGKHAHHSAKAVVSVLDPETEYKRVMGIVSDLILLDEWLLKYRRRIR
jgi:hypothetical protein